jgi:exopolysaccharide production protein ExoZ
MGSDHQPTSRAQQDVRKDGTLTNLQGLRALAALSVVLFHYGLMPVTTLPFQIGAAGVDIFFVLSGFIIALSSSRSARHFLAHRLIRILPAYWIATLIAAAFTLQNMDVAGAWDWLVQSLFYLSHPDGRSPLIFVAWTLVYELAFYLLYWLALRAGTRNAPFISLVMLLVLALAHPRGAPGPWPLLLEFALGIMVYLAVERFALFQSVPRWAGPVLAAFGFALLLTLPRVTGYDPDDYQGFGRVLCGGFPAAVMVLGMVVAEHRGIALRSKLALLLGAASYAIYLLHPIGVGQLLQLPASLQCYSWALCLAAAGATAAIAIAFHLLIEVPLLRRVRRALRDGLPVEQRAVAR